MSIYGVKWLGTSDTTWERTDDAASFTDPKPYVANFTEYSSPFDTISPWKDMVVETINGNSMVKIPKFWYKIEKDSTGLAIKISNVYINGYRVSPAHAERGDEQGAKDYIWVSRYKCSEGFKSITGVDPKTDITRAEFRTGIKSQGFYQEDFALYWTLRMLYLVEYANWKVEDTLGKSWDNTSEVPVTGLTDSIPYHSGTTAVDKSTRGHIQYRYIEGFYDMCAEFIDGIRIDDGKVYIIYNPEEFSDTENGTYVCDLKAISGCISSYQIPSVTTYRWAMLPSSVETGTKYKTFTCEYIGTEDEGPVVYAGPRFNSLPFNGLFTLVVGKREKLHNNKTGSRMMLLKKKD